MIKAVLLTTSLALVLASGQNASAQAQPQDDAINEAVMRQANLISLRAKLAEARSAQARKDTHLAAKLYQDCWSLVLAIGPSANTEARERQSRSRRSLAQLGARFSVARRPQGRRCAGQSCSGRGLRES